MKTRIGLVDDHQLFLKSLAMMLESFGNYEVVLEAGNGNELQQKIAHTKTIPDIIFLDVNMPLLNGIDTAKWMQQHYPSIPLIALSMNEDDHAIIEMLKAGCCAYLLKDTHPTELEKALAEIVSNGYYNADKTNLSFRRLLKQLREKPSLQISVKESIFLKYACSELTYKQIAAEMNLAERTIDGYRESLFQKLQVQSRVGLCLEALRRGLVTI